MTPDKVEAALGVLREAVKSIGIQLPRSLAELKRASSDEALSVLTEALAESRRDSALGREIATVFLPVMEAMRPLVLNLERLKDAAMKETP